MARWLVVLALAWLSGCASFPRRMHYATERSAAMNGARMEHAIYRPPDFREGEALPLVVFLHGGGDGPDVAAFETRYEHYRSANVPEALSNRMATLNALRSGLDLVAIAEATRLQIDRAANVYFGIGTALSLDWLRERIEVLGVEGHWQAVARTTLRDSVYELQRRLCLQVLEEKPRGSVNEILESWLAARKASVDAVRQTMSEMRSLPEMDFATLSVAVQAIRRVTE